MTTKITSTLLVCIMLACAKGPSENSSSLASGISSNDVIRGQCQEPDGESLVIDAALTATVGAEERITVSGTMIYRREAREPSTSYRVLNVSGWASALDGELFGVVLRPTILLNPVRSVRWLRWNQESDGTLRTAETVSLSCSFRKETPEGSSSTFDFNDDLVHPNMLRNLQNRMRQGDGNHPPVPENVIAAQLPRYYRLFNASRLNDPNIKSELIEGGFTEETSTEDQDYESYRLGDSVRPHGLGQRAIFYDDGRKTLATYSNELLQTTSFDADGNRTANIIRRLP